MRAHVIEGGKVINTIIVESLDFIPGLIDADAVGGRIGDSWDGEQIIPYVEPVVVPESITPRQGMLMLSRYDLLTTVQTMLDGMSGQEGAEARIDFERANEWRRDWPLLNAMATAAGLSSAQVDQMFIEGAQL